MSDSIDQTIEYQEQILEDLDDIKGSLDEESDYYDTEYQKEVLQSIKGIQKSVEALADNDLVELNYFNNFTANFGAYTFSSNQVGFSSSSAKNYYVFDVSNIDNFYIYPNGKRVDRFLSNSLIDNTVSANTLIDGKYFGGASYDPDLDYPTSSDGYHYLYLYNSDSSIIPGVKYYSSGQDGDEPEEPVEVVTTSSAVIIEGLDNLTQITTFQSFCSSLLIGILLFLVFVKGLRK